MSVCLVWREEDVLSRKSSVMQGEMEGEYDVQKTCCAACLFMSLETCIQLECEHCNFHVEIVTRQK